MENIKIMNLVCVCQLVPCNLGYYYLLHNKIVSQHNFDAYFFSFSPQNNSSFKTIPLNWLPWIIIIWIFRCNWCLFGLSANTSYREKWICRGRTIFWPRLSDLTPMELFIWENIRRSFMSGKVRQNKTWQKFPTKMAPCMLATIVYFRKLQPKPSLSLRAKAYALQRDV